MRVPEHNPSQQPAQALSANEREWLATILNAQPCPVLALDLTTAAIVFANDAARRHDLPSPAALPAYHAINAQGLLVDAGQLPRYLLTRKSDPEGVQLTWHTPDRAVCFRTFCRIITTPSGSSALALLTFLDITREKQAETDLREALEARNEFFSVATHELKDPLFALQLSIQLLRHAAERLGEVPEHVRKHLEVSHRQSDRLARLIDNLLDVARIANGRIHLDREALDLCELVRDMVARTQDKARSVGSTLEVISPESLIGYFDRLKLEQILGNLLTNAIKYSAGRPITVRVDGDDQTAVLEVEDRGVGIAPADQERIFHRFERASDSHKKASLGLGLYIVRSLVEAHGGTISVQSELGQGATFTVRLPRKRLPITEPACGNP